MSYASQSELANDPDFLQRVAAAAATEGIPPQWNNPLAWASEHIWEIAAAPGFAAQYESAQIAHIDRPGWWPDVITDAQILAVVQPMLNA